MFNAKKWQRSVLVSLAVLIFCGPMACAATGEPVNTTTTNTAVGPIKVYVPYKQLKDVLGPTKEGMFLPKEDFQRLWDAAHKSPAEVTDKPPVPYLISTARFTGEVNGNIAEMHMELTVDILTDDWVELPIGLGEVAVNSVNIKPADKNATADGKKIPELLQISGGGYTLLTKGKGRRVIDVNFVRQLTVTPGLHVLNYRLPAASITTLDLLIPEENMKVDVSPMLAATTSQVESGGKKNTKLQAFLGSAASVTLSWKPSTQAAETLTPVIVCNQLQTIRIDEALVNYRVDFEYDVLRRGVDGFTIQLPADFRVTNVTGANIAKWNLTKIKDRQSLEVSLFSPAKGKYSLCVEMERFLKQDKEELKLSPIVTHNVLRRTGLMAITHSPRRSVEMQKTVNLARVDVGRLPQNLQQDAVAYRFITADYSGVLVINTVEPRISVKQIWRLNVGDDQLALCGNLMYDVKKIGVFQLKMKFPEPWKIESITPAETVEDFELSGKGEDRELKILLRREFQGDFNLIISASQKRKAPTSPAEFTLPMPDAKNLQSYDGQLILSLSNRFRAEVSQMRQFQPLPLKQASRWLSSGYITSAMAFSFQTIDRAKPASLTFNIIARPTQVQADVYRLINVREGSISQAAVINYNIMYAPIDTLYVKLPASMADGSLQITGANIKEWPQIDKLPADVEPASTQSGIKWAYYKIILQAPISGNYYLNINTRKPFSPADGPQKIEILPILAAGKISDQRGYIVIAKDESLAIFQPEMKNITPADPGSDIDMPYAPFRNVGSMAYKYSLGEKADDMFALSFSVIRQKTAAVITTMASACVIEQTLGRDGTLNSHATFRIKTHRGDRLPFTLPKGAKLFGVMLNGAEAPVESTDDPDVRIIRLPPSSGQVEYFTVEITYSQTGVKACSLPAPTLPDSVPVQATFWRVWLPQEDVLLAYDRNFTLVKSAQLYNLAQQSGIASSNAFRLPASGKEFNFFRQGEGKALSLWSMQREWFAAVVWMVIVLIGLAMLKMGGFARCVIVVALLLAGAIVSLYMPLLAERLIMTGWPACLLVLLLWVVQWIFALAKRPRAKVPPIIAAVTTEVENSGQQGKE